MARLLNFLSLLLIQYLFILLEARGRRIDIFSQNGGDIGQLRSTPKNKNVMYNVLPRNSALRWTLQKDSNGSFVIPFTITGLYDRSETSIIMDAMERINQNKCIRFKRRENERDYVEIRNEQNEGCYTNVGRMTGQNVVMLEANEVATCVEPDIVIHELMHTIGLWHEHMRYDRDQYITVLYENIDPVYQSQFEKISSRESTTFGVPYDYRSVMHYAETAFARRGKISMVTKETQYQKVIGNQQDASPSDYRKICILYECQRCMGKNFQGENFVEQGPTKAAPPPSPIGGVGKSGEATPLPPITAPPPAVGLPEIRQGSGSCKDVFPAFCSVLVGKGVLDCNFLGKDYCCGSCAAAATVIPPKWSRNEPPQLAQSKSSGWFGWF